jgi:biotin carboxyl carrier protein
VVQGRPYVVEVQDARSRALASLAGAAHASGEATIRAPMPGLVSSVLVTSGEEVQRGQTIVVLEAMKMENDLTAPRAGYVRVLRVAKGQTVSQDEVLATIGDSIGGEAADESDDTDDTTA